MDNANQAQIDLWDGRVGEKWAAMQVSLDAMLAGATKELVRRVGPVAGLRVLDVGCGNGETCERWLAGGAEVTGVDVSTAMLAVAARRTQGRANLILADAAHWRSDALFDLVVSQFGVMFFDDPQAAFAAIGANLRPGGRLLFCCWRDVRENAWVSAPMAAVRDLLAPASAPASAPAGANQQPAPGPFALANEVRLRGILHAAGFSEIKIEPFDFPVCVAAEGGVPAAVRFLLQIGPTSAALAEVSKEVRAIAAERLATALAPFERDGRVELHGAIWMVHAARSAGN